MLDDFPVLIRESVLIEIAGEVTIEPPVDVKIVELSPKVVTRLPLPVETPVLLEIPEKLSPEVVTKLPLLVETPVLLKIPEKLSPDVVTKLLLLVETLVLLEISEKFVVVL